MSAGPSREPVSPGRSPLLKLSASRLASIGALVAAVCLAFWVHGQGGVTLDPAEWRERIAEYGMLAPLGFVVVASLRPFLLMPSWVIMSAGGLLFGVTGGVLIGTIGFTLGATLIFSVCRGLGRDVVARYAGDGRMGRIDSYLTERGPIWMAAWTGLPITPLTPVHAAAGLSGMPFLGFVAAVAVGFLPRTAVYSLFGDSLARSDYRTVGIAAVLLLIGVVLGVIATRRSAKREGGGDDDRPGPGSDQPRSSA
jgi:uncharacterized membrane protein YdjX (TVP38/TMEM64 family)